LQPSDAIGLVIYHGNLAKLKTYCGGTVTESAQLHPAHNIPRVHSEKYQESARISACTENAGAEGFSNGPNPVQTPPGDQLVTSPELVTWKANCFVRAEYTRTTHLLAPTGRIYDKVVVFGCARRTSPPGLGATCPTSTGPAGAPLGSCLTRAWILSTMYSGDTEKSEPIVRVGVALRTTQPTPRPLRSWCLRSVGQKVPSPSVQIGHIVTDYS
jgi:hypothetical protein